MTHPMIESNPEIMMEAPLVKGTRITVELIPRKLGAGETIEELLVAHPNLTREAILAALCFGADVLHADVTYLLPQTSA